jgi:hypothetical protein
MANRSYIYTCDREPGGKDFYARGLGEYGWDIPLAHKVLMGNAPRVTQSAIWDQKIGIVADRDGAFKKTLALFELIGEGTLKKRSEFDSELAEMKELFASAPPTPYLLLETGEILCLYDSPLDVEVKRLCDEIAALAPKVDRALAGKEAKWIATLRRTWEKAARPGYWSDVLYFSFEEPPKPKAKKQKAKKQAAKKKTAKKKPAKKAKR